MTTLAGKLFFTATILLMLFVAWKPRAFFRAMSFGRYREGDVAPGPIKILRWLAALTAVSLGIELLREILKLGV